MPETVAFVPLLKLQPWLGALGAVPASLGPFESGELMAATTKPVKLEFRDLKDRYLVLGGLMLLGLLVLAVRTYRLQVTRYDEYSQKSAANFVKEARLQGKLDNGGCGRAEEREGRSTA